MTEVTHKEKIEKRFIALSSVFAAIFLTAFKLIVGLMTRSLGLISEALHSGLDLIAALMTLFAVSIADKPADSDHHYGHEKIENFSALLETILLLITCGWIVYEAIIRLSTGKTDIDVNVWSYIVVISSIIIDFSRAKGLNRVAKKYNSQALEADALHFSTDIFSSFVVLFGLIVSSFNFDIADSIAALIVAVIVFIISLRLGKRSIDVLLDKSPKTLNKEDIRSIGLSIPEISTIHNIRIRTAGAKTFVDLNIHVDPDLTIQQAHDISHLVEEKIQEKIPKCVVHVHEEPEKEEV